MEQMLCTADADKADVREREQVSPKVSEKFKHYLEQGDERE